MRSRRARGWRLGAGMLLLSCAVALAHSPAPAQKPHDAKRAQALYEKALQKTNAAERIQLLEQAAQLCADDQSAALAPEIARQLAHIHYALGREFCQQARWQPAVSHLEKALASDPGFSLARTTLGLAYFQQGKYDAAIAAFEIVLRAQPTAALYNNLGAAHEAKGDLAAAVTAYSRALESDSRLAAAQKNLQRAQEKLSRALASAALEKSAAIDSIHVAAKPRDSLAVTAAKSLKGSPKPKTAKGGKAEAAPKSAMTAASVSPSNPPKKGNKTAAPTTNFERKLASSSSPALGAATAKPRSAPSVSSSPAAPIPSAPRSSPPAQDDPIAASSFPVAKTDSATAQIKRVVSAVASQTSEVLIHPSTTLSTSSSIKSAVARSSGKPAAPLVFGASVLLLAILAVVQRRRLGHVWLHLKLALAVSTAAVSRQVRLLPWRWRSESVARDELAAGVKLLPGPKNAEAPPKAEAAGLSPASKNEQDEPRQPSLQTQAFFAEMIAAEPEIDEFDDEALTKSGEAALPANGALTSKLDLAVDSTNAPSVNGLQQPVTSNQLSVTSNQSSVTSNQQPATSNQLSVTSDQQPATSDQLPAPSHEQQVLGRYLIERKIGKGAMGNIYLAFDPKLDRRVVIKTVCFNLASSETDTLVLKDRVYREARAIAKLGHPNIVVVYDVEDDKDMSYIVMEHIEGRDLRQALASEHRFDYPRALKIVGQVCSALDYAHQAGIIHRDIKPSNIMLLANDQAKVTDFGIAKIADNFSLTLPGHVLGTPSYMAPEQFEGEEIDGRADLFSLGVVLYELLTGGRPFAGDSLASLAYKIVHKMHIPPRLKNVELPLELDEIVGRALAKNPAERYATAMEFREALQGLQVEVAQ